VFIALAFQLSLTLRAGSFKFLFQLLSSPFNFIIHLRSAPCQVLEPLCCLQGMSPPFLREHGLLPGNFFIMFVTLSLQLSLELHTSRVELLVQVNPSPLDFLRQLTPAFLEFLKPQGRLRSMSPPFLCK